MHKKYLLPLIFPSWHGDNVSENKSLAHASNTNNFWTAEDDFPEKIVEL